MRRGLDRGVNRWTDGLMRGCMDPWNAVSTSQDCIGFELFFCLGRFPQQSPQPSCRQHRLRLRQLSYQYAVMPHPFCNIISFVCPTFTFGLQYFCTVETVRITPTARGAVPRISSRPQTLGTSSLARSMHDLSRALVAVGD